MKDILIDHSFGFIFAVILGILTSIVRNRYLKNYKQEEILKSNLLELIPLLRTSKQIFYLKVITYYLQIYTYKKAKKSLTKIDIGVDDYTSQISSIDLKLLDLDQRIHKCIASIIGVNKSLGHDLGFKIRKLKLTGELVPRYDLKINMSNIENIHENHIKNKIQMLYDKQGNKGWYFDEVRRYIENYFNKLS